MTDLYFKSLLIVTKSLFNIREIIKGDNTSLPGTYIKPSLCA